MNAFDYFLFPHTTLPEKNFRHFAALIPHLYLLQVADPPRIPEWGQEIFSTLPVISEEQVHQVKALLKEYKNFADLIRDGAVLSSLSHHTDEVKWHESRFRLQSMLKGQSVEQQLDEKQVATLEAALFLEMARDLDRQGMELETDLARAKNLDREFRDILGITGEEDLEEEPLEMGDLPFVAEKSFTTFMLTRRLAFWLRLFASIEAENIPVLVAVVPEVVDELFDPLMNLDGSISGTSAKVARIPLASIPALNNLEVDPFQSIMGTLMDSGIPQAFHKSIQRVLENPADAASIKELKLVSASLQERLAGYCEKKADSEPHTVQLSLMSTETLTIGSLWRKLDKIGSQLSASENALQYPVRVLLCETP